MPPVHQILKEARESMGLSLEEISQRTYIRLPYLIAIEEGALDQLPAPVYTFGYIRQYAKVLGLDGEALVAQYQQENTRQGQVRAAQPSRREPVNDLYHSPNGGHVNGQTRWNGAELPGLNGGAEHAMAEGPDLRNARQQASQMLGMAQREAEEMKLGAQKYTDQVLAQLEQELSKALAQVRNGRQYLKSRRARFQEERAASPQ